MVFFLWKMDLSHPRAPSDRHPAKCWVPSGHAFFSNDDEEPRGFKYQEVWKVSTYHPALWFPHQFFLGSLGATSAWNTSGKMRCWCKDPAEEVRVGNSLISRHLLKIDMTAHPPSSIDFLAIYQYVRQKSKTSCLRATENNPNGTSKS